jgi:hypothetical protein
VSGGQGMTMVVRITGGSWNKYKELTDKWLVFYYETCRYY